MRAYICLRISLMKPVSSGPPCCFGVVRLVLSIHDNFGDEDGTLEDFTVEKVKDLLSKIHTTSQDAN